MTSTSIPADCRRHRQHLLKLMPGSARLETLELHLQRCPGCSEFARHVGELEYGLRVPYEEESSAILAERIMHQVEVLGRPERRPVWTGPQAWAAGVALLLVLVGWGVLRGNNPQPAVSANGTTPAKLASLTAGMGPSAAFLAETLPGSASDRLQQEALLVAEDLEAAAGFLVACWEGSASILHRAGYQPNPQN